MTEPFGTARRWRSRTTTHPLAARTNGHSKQGKRVRDLYRAHLSRIGDPGEVLAQAACLAASELEVAVEDCRAKVLADPGNADLADALVRLANLAHRAEHKLAQFGGPKRPTLAGYLAERKPQQRLDSANRPIRPIATET
jgi:hypothetical protein